MNNEEMKKRIAKLEKVFLKETERLEMKIKGLENDLDYLEEQLKDADRIKKAIVEIEEHLNKQQKG